MGHLRPEEFTELIDGELRAGRAAHLAQCAACRAAVDEMRDALHGASSIDVPEPSPLFWQHFSSRVQDAIARDAAVHGAPAAWRRPAPVVWAFSAVIATFVLAAVFGRALLPEGARQPSPAGTSSTRASAAPASALPVAVAALETDIEDDSAWALVRVIADDVAWEHAHTAGLTAAPGSAEGLALELSAHERAELARLIAEELKQSGA